MTENDLRLELLKIIEREFIGPNPINRDGFLQASGEEILVGTSPREKYLAGVLHPQKEDFQQNNLPVDDKGSLEETNLSNKADIKDDALETDVSGRASDNLNESDPPEELINCSNAYLQSAISITVAIPFASKIIPSVSCGRYHSGTRRVSENFKPTTYSREAISWDNDNKPLSLPNKKERICESLIPNTSLKFCITYRYSFRTCNVFTFTLLNSTVTSGNENVENTYYQAYFRIHSSNGFDALPEPKPINCDEDYLSNSLLYRHIKNYAIGHGCGTNWDDNTPVKWVETAIFPNYEVKAVVPTAIKGSSLEMRSLASESTFSEALESLESLCNQYSEWIEEKKIEARALNFELDKKTADRHIKNCEVCLSRMRDGILLLREDNNVQTAFRFMNVAMLMQQLHYGMPLHKWEASAETSSSNSWVTPDLDNDKTWPGNKNRYGKWRPFQLAFILMNLRAIAEKNSEDRKIIDLIWFPTGGGKTEAYLGLSAYTMFLRRILHKDDYGTYILMRYTLRLLTAQQYQRAAALVCACEFLRFHHSDIFGEKRFSIGLWVGSATTPNAVKEACDKLKKLQEGKTEENPFIILKCPWCGSQMGPVKCEGQSHIRTIGYHEKKGGRYKKYFVFNCENPNCYFCENTLPLKVIDEDIYDDPPSLLIGTVDKFAMLPFVPEAQSIFGYRNGEKISSPALIIQDELHLISGPLGSMVGHYETMISSLCEQHNEKGIFGPKIVASTATISHAKGQCAALYGCSPSQVFQFPPAGLDSRDSFFAREDSKKAGRKYVGILAPNSSDTTVAIRLFASLLYAAKELQVDNEVLRDPYWTNLAYFNSIRELGQASTWIHADIEQYLDSIYNGREPDKEKRELLKEHRRYINLHEELTSRIDGSKVTESLEKLNISYKGKSSKYDDTPIDICLATNMISVGLDVPRLGLMTVAGQPKTTSEYIQATSRVGRDAQNAPGIVFVLYRPSRPRDKSHYEHFKSYHSKLYAHVEPTSVTPFSAPVRERALHAIVIGILRMKGTKEFNEGKPVFPLESQTEIQNILKSRIESVDPEELEDSLSRLDKIIKLWDFRNPSVWSSSSPSPSIRPLMYYSGTTDLWEGASFKTPTSMRTVDRECKAKPLTDPDEKE